MRNKTSHPSTAQKKPKAAPPNLLSLFPEYRKKAYQERVASAENHVVADLRECYLHKGLVLHLGAGVSRSLGLPSWQELIRSLTVTMMSRKVQTAIEALGKGADDNYWQLMLSIHEDVEKGADYEKPMLIMARAIKDELGDALPGIVARLLERHHRAFRLTKISQAPAVRNGLVPMLPGQRARIERSRRSLTIMRLAAEQPGPYSPLVEAIIALARSERDACGVQAIINYNYDDLIDEILREENVRCKTVRSGKDKVARGMLPCYHVHGILPVYSASRTSVRHRRARVDAGNFVFSEDEYHAEYTDPYRWSNMTQMSHLGRYSGLFVGVSMEDPNMRRLVDVTHRQYPEIQHYAILPRKKSLQESQDSKECVLRNLFEQVETTSFDKIGVKVIWVDNYDEIPAVLSRISKINGEGKP